MLKIPFPNLYISNFSEEDAPRTPRPPAHPPEQTRVSSASFQAPPPPPPLLKIALRRPCVYSHPLPSEKKRSKWGSFENKALENEDRSTKLPKLETTVS